jgi:replicative DNA helicase
MSTLRDIESERALLGVLLFDNSVGAEACEMVGADDFDPRHRPIWEAICRAVDSRQAFDEVTVIGSLRDRGALDFVGGPAAVTTMLERTATSANWRMYARRVKVAGMLRRLSDAAAGVAMECGEAALDTDEAALTWFADAQKRIVDATTYSGGARNFSTREVMGQVMRFAEERHEQRGKMLGFPTGFAGLDDKLLGLRRKRFYVVAAKTGIGKTAFALNMLWHASAAGARSYVVSLEMGVDELALRMASAASNVPGLHIETGALQAEDFARLFRGIGDISDLPITWPESPPTTIAGLRAACQALKRRHGLDLLVVDYLQLVSGDGDTHEQQISAISRGLKMIGTELDIAVVALSQLNRKQDRHAEPELIELRGSGSIEQDANVVLFLWTENDELTAPVLWKLGKNRGGFLGRGSLAFKRATQRFVEAAV